MVDKIKEIKDNKIIFKKKKVKYICIERMLFQEIIILFDDYSKIENISKERKETLERLVKNLSVKLLDFIL